jgi:hypothetical protein
MKYACTEERFLSDVAQHELIILRDDGVMRHIRLKRPRSYTYYFDILTWPGRLCICGDMGTYVFARVHDMFEFFRREPCDRGALPINPDYWSGKLEAHAGNGRSKTSVFRFDQEKFDAAVRRDVADYMRHNMRAPYYPEAEDCAAWGRRRRELIEAVRDEVLDRCEDEAMRAVWDFSHTYENGSQHWDETLRRMVPTTQHFHFQDFYERHCESFDFSFIWACYAIVWAVQRYDAETRPWYNLPVGELRKRSPAWKRQHARKEAA